MPKWPHLLMVALVVAAGAGMGPGSRIKPALAQARAPGPGNLVSGDVQSAGTGPALATPEHDALELDRIQW